MGTKSSMKIKSKSPSFNGSQGSRTQNNRNTKNNKNGGKPKKGNFQNNERPKKPYPQNKHLTPEESKKESKEDMTALLEKIQSVITKKSEEMGLSVSSYYADQAKLDVGSVSIDIVLTLEGTKSGDKNITFVVTREQRMRNFNLAVVGGNVGRRKVLFSSYGDKEITIKKIEKYIPNILESTKVILQKISDYHERRGD